MRPLFILSLPRSGSTLLQRLLAGHRDIATAPEPWILIPPLYALRKQGVYAEYGHHVLVDAIEDFCAQLTNGKAEYLEEVRNFALSLYRKAANKQATYFLDKTPRYHLIAQDLMDVFPDGKFIFLWRSPLAIASSIIETWGSGDWILAAFYVDLFDGLSSLVNCFTRNTKNCYALRYEDLVRNPDPELNQLLNFLQLPSTTTSVQELDQVHLGGRMGDERGKRPIEGIRTASLDRWKRTFSNRFRKHWAQRYLDWIGEERLRIMGYSLSSITQELRATPTSSKGLILDSLRAARGELLNGVKTAIFSHYKRTGTNRPQ